MLGLVGELRPPGLPPGPRGLSPRRLRDQQQAVGPRQPLLRQRDPLAVPDHRDGDDRVRASAGWARRASCSRRSTSAAGCSPGQPAPSLQLQAQAAPPARPAGDLAREKERERGRPGPCRRSSAATSTTRTPKDDATAALLSHLGDYGDYALHPLMGLTFPVPAAAARARFRLRPARLQGGAQRGRALVPVRPPARHGGVFGGVTGRIAFERPPMPRIKEAFARARAQNRAAFIAYLCAGDPDFETSLAACRAVVGAGADILELGVPFSDPLADGLTNQLAAQRALEAGMTVGKGLRAGEADSRVERGADRILHLLQPRVLERRRGLRPRGARGRGGRDAHLDLPPEEAEAVAAASRAHGSTRSASSPRRPPTHGSP
jgi:hypothetical protein